MKHPPKLRPKTRGSTHLRLVVDNANPVPDLYGAYQRAHRRWHETKSEQDRQAARDAYNAWAVSFLGEQGAASVKVSEFAAWGFA